MCDQSTQRQDIFYVDYHFKATTVKVVSSSLILLPGSFCFGEASEILTMLKYINYVVVLSNKRKCHLSEKTLEDICDITAADDRIMVLDCKNNVFVFTDVSVSEGTRLHSSCNTVSSHLHPRILAMMMQNDLMAIMIVSIQNSLRSFQCGEMLVL